MTRFPARAMSIEDWTVARVSARFIPVEYSAEIYDILSAVSWALLMKCGLSIIAKFKAIVPVLDIPYMHLMHSWAID